MQLKKLNDHQLKALAQLKDSDLQRILEDEAAQVVAQLMICQDDVLTRWLQGKQQMLFEIIETIKTARGYLNGKSQRKEHGNAF